MPLPFGCWLWYGHQPLCNTCGQTAVRHATPRHAQVATALKLSEEDQATINALKREIEKSWRLVDAAHEKARMAVGSVCRNLASAAPQVLCPRFLGLLA